MVPGRESASSYAGGTVGLSSTAVRYKVNPQMPKVSHVWNKLPTRVSSALTLSVFRRHLKHHFFLDAYLGFTAPAINIESIMPST